MLIALNGVQCKTMQNYVNNKTNHSLILSSENLLHLAEWMEDIRENQCEPPKNVSAGFLGIIKENEA